MKILYIQNGHDDKLFQQLHEWFIERGHNSLTCILDSSAYPERPQQKDEHFYLVDEILRVGPHVVHASCVGYPLIVAQIACGIPTVVQAQDDLGQDYEDMIKGDARAAVSDRMYRSFTMTNASALVTTNKELVNGYRPQNPCSQYIPEIREIEFGDYARQDAEWAIIGSVPKAVAEDVFPRDMQFLQLGFGKSRMNIPEGNKYGGVFVTPDYALDKEKCEQLCAMGVPIVRASKGERGIDDGMPFTEYSMDNYPRSFVDAWEGIRGAKPEVYEAMCEANKERIVGHTIDKVGEAYLELYEGVVRKAMLRTPVRGW